MIRVLPYPASSTGSRSTHPAIEAPHMSEERVYESRRYRFASDLSKELIRNLETLVFPANRWKVPVGLGEGLRAPSVTKGVNGLQNPNFTQRQYSIFSGMDFGVGRYVAAICRDGWGRSVPPHATIGRVKSLDGSESPILPHHRLAEPAATACASEYARISVNRLLGTAFVAADLIKR